VRELLTALKREFGKEDNKSTRVAELKQLKQGPCTMDKFVQMFRRVARGSGYKRRALIEEFKRRINSNIGYKLIEIK